MLPELGPQIALDLPKVDRSHRCTRSSIDPWLIPDNVRSEGLGESAYRLTEVTLEELNDGRWEVEIFGFVEDVLFGEGVGCHPLGEITDNLGRGRDLDDITAL